MKPSPYVLRIQIVYQNIDYASSKNCFSNSNKNNGLQSQCSFKAILLHTMSHNSWIYNIWIESHLYKFICEVWFRNFFYEKKSILMVKYFTVNLLLVHISAQAITKLDIRMDYYKKGTNVYLVKHFFCKHWSQL